MHQRFAELGKADTEARTAPLTVSTDTPVQRDGYFEVLDHAPGSVDLSRAPLPLLVSHNTKQLPVGVVEGLRVEGGKLRGVARFSNSPVARQIFDDVIRGIARGVSVGYEYLSEGVRIAKDTFQFKFRPFEASVVAVAADINAGFFRERRNMEQETEYQARGARRLAERQRIAAQLQTIPAGDLQSFRSHLEMLGDEDGDGLSIGAVLRAVNVQETYQSWRADFIRSYGARYARYGGDELATQAIANPGMTAAAFRESVLEKIDQAQSGRLNTGELEADRLPNSWGSGARVSERYGNLQAFRGKDAEQRAYACGMFFRSIAGDQKAATWCRDNGIVASRVMTEGVFSAGGAAVPAIVAAEIISNVEMYGTFRRFARNWPMTSATLAVPTNGEGLTIAAVGETTATPTSDLSLGQVTLNTKEFAGGARASRSLLEDNVVALGDFLISEFGRGLAKIEDQCGWIADGTSTYGGMQGIAYRLKNDANVAGGKVVAATATHDTFAEIDVTDLVTLMGAVPEYARAGSAWYCSATAKDLVFSRLLITAGGNNTQTMTGAPAESFLGYPIRTSPVLPAGAATDYSGEVMLLFGNLAMASAFGDRRALMAEIDTSRYVEFRQTYFQVSERFDIVNHLNGTTATVCGPMAALIGGAS